MFIIQHKPRHVEVRESEEQLHACLVTAVDGEGGSSSRPGPYTNGEEAPNAQWIEYMFFTACPDAVRGRKHL